MGRISVLTVARAAVAFWPGGVVKTLAPLGLLAAAGSLAAVFRYLQSPALVVAYLVQVAAWVIGAGALFRLALADELIGGRDARTGPLGLQWTRTEGRLLGVYALVTLARFLPAGVGLVGLAIAAASSAPSQLAARAIGGLVAVAGFGLVLFVWLSLSLSPAATVAEGRLSLSWGLTRGARGPMVAAYLAVLGPVMALALAVGVAVLAMVGPGEEARRSAGLFMGVAMSLIMAFAYLPLGVGVTAELYRRLRETP